MVALLNQILQKFFHQINDSILTENIILELSVCLMYWYLYMLLYIAYQEGQL